MLGTPGLWALSSLSLEAPQPYPITAGIVTIQQGVCELVPETGLEDSVTQVLLGTNFASTIANHYPLIWLRAGDGYSITLVNGASIELAGGINLVLSGDVTFFGYHTGSKLIDNQRAASGADLFSYLYFK